MFSQTIFKIFFLMWLSFVTANDFAGANSYFLYTLSVRHIDRFLIVIISMPTRLDSNPTALLSSTRCRKPI